MAQTTDLTRSLDLHLLAVEDLLAELPEVAAIWDELPESEQAAWPMDWAQAMATLQLVHQAFQSGQLTLAQQARYRAVLGRLRAALPALEQLCLQRPTVPLEPSPSAGDPRPPRGPRLSRRPRQQDVDFVPGH